MPFSRLSRGIQEVQIEEQEDFYGHVKKKAHCPKIVKFYILLLKKNNPLVLSQS